MNNAMVSYYKILLLFLAHQRFELEFIKYHKTKNNSKFIAKLFALFSVCNSTGTPISMTEF